MPGEWRSRIVATIAGITRTFASLHVIAQASELYRAILPTTIRRFFDIGLNCMSRRITPAILALTAAISVSLCCWSFDRSHAQQARPGTQKGSAGAKAGGNVPGGNAQGGDEGGGRSPALPHIARARQLINQAQ